MNALALVFALSFAQQGAGLDNGGLSRGNLLRIPDYKATSSQSWFVNASTGNDSFDCRSASTPCLTIQGALNKVPKLLQYGVTVTVAAGTYGCFYVSGFTCDPSVQQSSGGLLIDGFGAFTNSTLATGTATGTATAGSAGSGTTYGTLTDGAQTWTVNDLRGRFLVLTGGTGSGQSRVISSNTGTAITITGVFSPAPNATTTYAIQDPSVIINTACSSPALPLTSAGANAAAMLFYDNNCGARRQSLAVRGVRTTNASGLSVAQSDNSATYVTLSQLRNSAASSSAVQYGVASNASSTNAMGAGDLGDVTITAGASASAIQVLSGLAVGNRVQVIGGNNALFVSGINATASFTALESIGAASPVLVSTGRLSTLSQTQLTCASGAGTAVNVGAISTTTTTGAILANGSSVNGVAVATCGIGVLVNGFGASADLTGVTGSAATTGIQAQSGGSLAFTTGTTITGGTSDINLDSGGVTAALADVAAGTCLQSAQFNSKVCAR